jgi:hypothetical protein
MASLQDILQRQTVWRGGAPAAAGQVVSTGYQALDRALPGGGWPAGALTEILWERQGFGELQLVLPAFAALTRQRKRVAWLAPPHLPYAPALAAAGVDLEYMTVVRAPGRRDALWAAEQVLRAGACHALLGWLPDARYTELRRLAVAIEDSPAIATLFRSPQAAAEPSPACLRLLLEAREGGLVAHILKRRGAPASMPVDIPARRPVHAVGGARLPAAADRIAAARPRLVPVAG